MASWTARAGSRRVGRRSRAARRFGASPTSRPALRWLDVAERVRSGLRVCGAELRRSGARSRGVRAGRKARSPLPPGPSPASGTAARRRRPRGTWTSAKASRRRSARRTSDAAQRARVALVEPGDEQRECLERLAVGRLQQVERRCPAHGPSLLAGPGRRRQAPAAARPGGGVWRAGDNTRAPRRGELDRERHAVQAAADRDDRVGVRRLEGVWQPPRSRARRRNSRLAPAVSRSAGPSGTASGSIGIVRSPSRSSATRLVTRIRVAGPVERALANAARARAAGARSCRARAARLAHQRRRPPAAHGVGRVGGRDRQRMPRSPPAPPRDRPAREVHERRRRASGGRSAATARRSSSCRSRRAR